MSLHPSDPGYCPAPSYANEPTTYLDAPIAYPGAPPTPVDLTPKLRFLDERPGCRHDVTPDCDAHGCPYCQDEREQLPWIDPCETCVQLRQAGYEAFVALNPALGCERAEHLRCETCGRCGICSGGVCRDCGCCLEHADDYGPCWAGNVWNRARRCEVPFARHTFYDLASERWGR